MLALALLVAPTAAAQPLPIRPVEPTLTVDFEAPPPVMPFGQPANIPVEVTYEYGPGAVTTEEVEIVVQASITPDEAVSVTVSPSARSVAPEPAGATHALTFDVIVSFTGAAPARMPYRLNVSAAAEGKGSLADATGSHVEILTADQFGILGFRQPTDFVRTRDEARFEWIAMNQGNGPVTIRVVDIKAGDWLAVDHVASVDLGIGRPLSGQPDAPVDPDYAEAAARSREATMWMETDYVKDPDPAYRNDLGVVTVTMAQTTTEDGQPRDLGTEHRIHFNIHVQGAGDGGGVLPIPSVSPGAAVAVVGLAAILVGLRRRPPSRRP